MSIDSLAFRHTVGQFATGVTVIATGAGDSFKAMTANAFTSLSLDPPLVLFCVSKKAHMSAAIRSAVGFSVNILASEQKPLSTYFAGTWRESAPPAFSFTPWEGGPRLEGVTAALGCAIESILEGGDHWIVIGRVLALYRAEDNRPPLLFHAGRYGALVDFATTS